jgi:hypothetical protein
MTLLGKGALVIWHDPEAEAESDYNEWHSKEHMFERVGIPGFRRGQRGVAISGAPRYFNLYEVDGFDVLTSPAYLARLNDPTAWTRRIVQVGLDEARPPGEPELVRQPARGRDRRAREIEPDHLGAALRQRQAVAAEVALQMQDAQPRDRAELGLLDRTQPVMPGAQRRDVVERRPQMDRDPLVPVGAVDVAPVLVRHGHPQAPPIDARLHCR